MVLISPPPPPSMPPVCWGAAAGVGLGLLAGAAGAADDLAGPLENMPPPPLEPLDPELDLPPPINRKQISECRVNYGCVP